MDEYERELTHIPKARHSKLIGYQQAVLRRLQRETGCDVEVPSTESRGASIIVAGPSEAAVDKCIRAIEKLVGGAEVAEVAESSGTAAAADVTCAQSTPETCRQRPAKPRKAAQLPKSSAETPATTTSTPTAAATTIKATPTTSAAPTAALELHFEMEKSSHGKLNGPHGRHRKALEGAIGHGAEMLLPDQGELTNTTIKLRLKHQPESAAAAVAALEAHLEGRGLGQHRRGAIRVVGGESGGGGGGGGDGGTSPRPLVAAAAASVTATQPPSPAQANKEANGAPSPSLRSVPVEPPLHVIIPAAAADKRKGSAAGPGGRPRGGAFPFTPPPLPPDYSQRPCFYSQ